MPLTPIAALMYPFFLLPGLVFLNRVETHLPARKRSIFRETATVVLASIGSAAFVLVTYVFVSIWWTLPIDGLVMFTADPATTFKERPRASIFWMLVFLLLACFVAWVAATQRVYALGEKVLWTGNGPDLTNTTVWRITLLPSDPDDEVMVGVQLKSGIWVQGAHDAHSDVEVEVGDRQLVLRSPIKYRLKDDNEVQELKPYDRLVVSASEIDYMASYQKKQS